MGEMAVIVACWVHSMHVIVLWFGGTTHCRQHTPISVSPSWANTDLVIRPQMCWGLWSDRIGGCCGKCWSLYCGAPWACISSSLSIDLCQSISMHFTLGWKHWPRLVIYVWLKHQCPGLYWYVLEGHHMSRWKWSLPKLPAALPLSSHSRSCSWVCSIVRPLGAS